MSKKAKSNVPTEDSVIVLRVVIDGCGMKKSRNPSTVSEEARALLDDARKAREATRREMGDVWYD